MCKVDVLPRVSSPSIPGKCDPATPKSCPQLFLAPCPPPEQADLHHVTRAWEDGPGCGRSCCLGNERAGGPSCTGSRARGLQKPQGFAGWTPRVCCCGALFCLQPAALDTHLQAPESQEGGWGCVPRVAAHPGCDSGCSPRLSWPHFSHGGAAPVAACTQKEPRPSWLPQGHGNHAPSYKPAAALESNGPVFRFKAGSATSSCVAKGKLLSLSVPWYLLYKP